MLSVRQLQIAFKTTCLQKFAHTYPNQTHIHPLRVRSFASKPPGESYNIETLQDSPLFQKLVSDPHAVLALKEFQLSLREQGIDLFSDRPPPSAIELFAHWANPALRKAFHKLQEDLAKSGVDLDPKNGMELLKAFRGQNTKI